MSLIENERAKLLANALDRASTACLAIGVLGPSVTVLYDLGETASHERGILVSVGSVLWLVTAAALHWMAYRVLGRLE